MDRARRVRGGRAGDAAPGSRRPRAGGRAGPVARLLRTKPAEEIVAEGGRGAGGELRRTMSLTQLTMFSVGATLGTGIFVILGQAVPLAGPAVVLAFLLAAGTALLSALSYAELAGTIPVSGSSYSYAYATLGELAAWVCGWCLMLEYGVSVAAVAVGWGEYLNRFLRDLTGRELPAAIVRSPGEPGGVVNLTAILIVLLAAWLLLRGTSESAAANAVFVLLKVAVLVFFCAVAFTAFQGGNLAPFAPLGAAGVTAAASQVFFSYIGFDAAATAGEEARNPRRDLPLAIVFSLLLVTALYVLVALAAVGALPWTDFDPETTEAGLALIASRAAGPWASLVVSFGAVIAIASVVLTVLYGQTRILFAMSRDGLIPPVFQRVEPRRRLPAANTLLVAAFVAALAGLVPLGRLAEATSIGTLFAFAVVNLGVLVLRRTRPDLPRGFRTPLFPLTPVLGAACCAMLMAGLDAVTWLAFLLWLAGGLVVYLGYGVRHSRLERPVRGAG